jgi:hypothetical protein
MHCCCYGHTAKSVRWSEPAVQLLSRRFKIILVRLKERVYCVCCCSDTANRAELAVSMWSQVRCGLYVVLYARANESVAFAVPGLWV